MGSTVTEEHHQCLLTPVVLQAVPNAPCFQDLALEMRTEPCRA